MTYKNYTPPAESDFPLNNSHQLKADSFEDKAPNAVTRTAMEEVDAGDYRRFGTTQELFDDLENNSK